MKKEEWALYSFFDGVHNQASDSDSEILGMTSYDIYHPMKRGKGVLISRKKYPRLTKEQKPIWKKRYAAFVRHGMTLTQAKRRASGLMRGMTEREAMGHADELIAEKYNAAALFAMHQYMERQLQHYLKLEMELADISEINIEDNTEYKTRHRRFLWQLTDMGSGNIRLHLIYEKGQILEKKMWEGFDYLDFKINIRELKKWE